MQRKKDRPPSRFSTLKPKFEVRQLKNAETIERYSVRPRLKILENNQQKNQRTQKKRERPTRLLSPRPKTKQLATPMFHEEPLAIGSAFPLDGINRGNRNSGYL
ncbi:hypothetical protein ES702_04314 [subsurface metagenome]